MRHVRICYSTDNEFARPSSNEIFSVSCGIRGFDIKLDVTDHANANVGNVYVENYENCAMNKEKSNYIISVKIDYGANNCGIAKTV